MPRSPQSQPQASAGTKVDHVYTALQADLASGRYVVGDKMPSVADLAERFVASPRVVREAVIRLSAQGVVRQMRGSGTFVTAIPSAGTLVILNDRSVQTDPNAYVYGAYIHHLHDLCEQAGWQMTLELLTHPYPPEASVCMRHGFASAMVTWVDPPSEQWAREAETLPLVCINPKPWGRYRIHLDFATLNHLAFEAVCQAGYRSLAVFHLDASVIGPWNASQITELHQTAEAFGDRLKVSFIPIRSRDISHESFWAFKSFWQKTPRPEAVFMQDDCIADGATRAMMSLGIQCPEQLGVVTALNLGRNIPFSRPLTAVAFDPAAVAQAAWNLVINGLPLERHVVIRPELLRGETL